VLGVFGGGGFASGSLRAVTSFVLFY